MGRERSGAEGRGGAWETMRTALRSCAQRGRLVVVRGPAGIGKTWLLEEWSRRWRSQGVRIAEVRGTSRDRYGVDAVVGTLRENFDRFGAPELIDGIDALVRLHQRDPNGRSFAVMAELCGVFEQISSPGGTAVLIDDVLEIPEPATLVMAARRPGCLVVVSVRTDTEQTGKSAEILELADEVLELEPLKAEDISAVAGCELDANLHHGLRAALGPLYGNPGTVLAVLQALNDEGRLVAEDGRLALAEPRSPIVLPIDHHLMRRAAGLGAPALRLIAVTAAEGTLDVDELPTVAATLGVDVETCGRTVDRLVENGLLVSDPSGRLRCVCAALGNAAVRAAHTTPSRLSTTKAAPQFTGRRASADTPSQKRSPRWSATEVRITELISTGITNRQIASKLGLSEKTVESHLTRLFARSGCRSRVALLAKADREGRLWGNADAARRRTAA
jgi:DNA-binding CsgD family transcriptional regulator